MTASWEARAACRRDPGMFSDERAWRDALKVCRGCPVQRQCLDLALRTEGGAPADHRWGVFGGTTSKQRAKLARAQAEVTA